MGESRMVCLLMNEAAIWWKLYIMTFPRPCPLSFALDLRRTGAGTLRDRTFRTRPATRPSTPPKAAPPLPFRRAVRFTRPGMLKRSKTSGILGSTRATRVVEREPGT